MISVVSNESILIRVVGALGTSSFQQIRKTRREMGNNIVLISDSEILNSVGNSRGKVKVTNSWRAKSVEFHLVSRDEIAEGDVKSSMGSKGTAQTVTGKQELVASVLVSKSSELSQEVSSEGRDVLLIEILSDNSVVDAVKTISNGLRLEGFFH